MRFANGQKLVKGNEIRSGGFRVGVVEDMKPVKPAPARPAPSSSSSSTRRSARSPRTRAGASARARRSASSTSSSTRAHSKQAFQDGDTIPLEQTDDHGRPRPGLQDVRRQDARGRQQNLRGFGDSFAGRGTAVGRTIEEAPRLLQHLEPVAANLADPATELPRFFKELGDAARIVEPISKTNAHLFTTMADTWEAVGRDPEALRDTISSNT